MKMNLNAIEPANGGVMSDLVGGYYLNYNPFNHDFFYAAMRTEEPPIQHNFTVLCLQWFRTLSTAKDFDGRNEDSVLFAKSIAVFLNPDLLCYENVGTKDDSAPMAVDYKDGISVKKAVAIFLCTAADNDRPFIERMLRQHRTLQQNFSRFCAEWLKTAPDNPAIQQSPLLAAVTNAMALYNGFPYV